MPSLGGGPPALSLLVGVARGVDKETKYRADQQREAILNAMRQDTNDIARGHLAVAKAQEQRLGEERATKQASAVSKAADVESAVKVRAGELMQQYGMPEGRARMRARAEVTNQLSQLPVPKAPPTPEEAAHDKAILTGEQQANAERARQTEFDNTVQKALRNPVIAANLAQIRDPNDLVALARYHPDFQFDHLLAAWKAVGGPSKAADADVEEQKTAATVDANRHITKYGSADAALAEVAKITEVGAHSLDARALARLEAERQVLEAIIAKKNVAEE